MSLKRWIGTAVVVGAVGGLVYLATIGCCQMMGWGNKKSVSLTAQLGLSKSQRKEVAELEKNFLARKAASCDTLCAKRAQLIQLLQQENPDRETLNQLVGEIGMEQAALERATLEHLLAVREKLDPAQRATLAGRVTDQLRAACRATACGATSGCSVTTRGE